LTKEYKVCIGKKIAYSTNGAGKTGYPHAEDGNYLSVSHLGLLLS
jgi:hypothetical protein